MNLFSTCSVLWQSFLRSYSPYNIYVMKKIYSYENEQECTEEQQSSEIRERNGSESNRFGNHPQTDDITLTAKRTHNCRSGGANHAQDTACNGNG